MNKRWMFFLVPALVLALVTLGCKPPTLPFGSRATPTLGAAPATAKPGQPTAKPPAGLGELKTCEPGGYTYRLIPNYKHDTAGSTVTMVAEGGDIDVGPLIMLGSSPLKSGQTAQTLFEDLKKTSNEMTFKDPKAITIGGFPALAIDFSGQTKSKDLKGRLILAVVSSDRYFMMIGGAPPATWDKSLEDLFDAEVKVITFFEPKVPPTSTPRPTTAPAVRTPTQPVTARTATSAPTVSGGSVIRQWAVSARASSEYGVDEWSAKQATGAPNTPKCEDSKTAWASQDPDETAWLELDYATPVRPTTIVIVQSYSPSSVVKVETRDLNGKYTTVWSGAAEKKSGCPFYQSFAVSNQNFLVSGVKITIDQAKIGDWNEIDAVELVGTPGTGGPTLTLAPSAGGLIYPKPPDAKIVMDTPETVILSTKLTQAEAMTFYRNETKKIGLTERSGVTVIAGSTFSMVFDGAAAGKSLVVQGVSMPDGTIMITMRYEKV